MTWSPKVNTLMSGTVDLSDRTCKECGSRPQQPSGSALSPQVNDVDVEQSTSGPWGAGAGCKIKPLTPPHPCCLVVLQARPGVSPALSEHQHSALRSVIFTRCCHACQHGPVTLWNRPGHLMPRHTHTHTHTEASWVVSAQRACSRLGSVSGKLHSDTNC